MYTTYYNTQTLCSDKAFPSRNWNSLIEFEFEFEEGEDKQTGQWVSHVWHGKLIVQQHHEPKQRRKCHNQFSSRITKANIDCTIMLFILPSFSINYDPAERRKKAHKTFKSMFFLSQFDFLLCIPHHLLTISSAHSVYSFSFVYAHAHKFNTGISNHRKVHTAHCNWLLLFDCDVRKRSEFIPLIFISTSVVYITIDAHHLLLLLAKVFFLLHCFGSWIKKQLLQLSVVIVVGIYSIMTVITWAVSSQLVQSE